VSYLVALALGSNLGDRAHHLRSAIDRLKTGVRIVRISQFIESDAANSPGGSPSYLNGALTGCTLLDPAQLLAFTEETERSLGRRNKGGNRPRTIDIDLIFHGSSRIRTRTLQIPHPRWSERGFVLEPLNAIGAPWIGPWTAGL